MLIKVAWRNIWRNRLRSLVVILSIALGLWAGVFTMGLSKGLSDQRTENSISTYISHIQVHTPEYKQEQEVKDALDQPEEIAGFLGGLAEVKSHTERMLVTGMGSSANGASGVQIQGIDPDQEQQVTDIYEKIVEGNYFTSTYKHPIVIGRKLAEKLKVKERSKIVLTFQDQNGDLTAGAFRITGIFKTSNTPFDEGNVFIRRGDLAELFGTELVHEIAVILEDIETANAVRDRVNEQFPGVLAETFGEVAPDIGYYNEVLDQTLYIFVAVILLAMAFGIINTMLMAVLERRHELGMLLCIGMSKLKVFGMILIESIFIACIGGPTGLLLAALSFGYFGRQGIDLSIVGEGLESFGIETVVYPTLETIFFVNVTIMVVATALLAALYPARKAVKYNPAEAVRAI